MSDTFKQITITITENGYIVKTKEDKKTFVFEDYNKFKLWLEENISTSGEIDRFNKNL